MRRTRLPTLALAVTAAVLVHSPARAAQPAAATPAPVAPVAPAALQPSAPPAPAAPQPAVTVEANAQVDAAGSTKPIPPAGADTQGASAATASASVSGAKAREGRPAANDTGGRFEFGSYGRISVASDFRGRTGRPADIVAYGSRVDEPSYSEFELRREDTFSSDIKTRVVTTLALFPNFFHFTGNSLQHIGVRNLYVQGSYKDLTMWAGSRMYRGDDIYLLNWWPLDNQNTLGGGAILRLPSDLTVALHAGMQRLDHVSQFQTIQAVAPYGFGTVPVTFLDRPRTIETLKVTQFFRRPEEKGGMKLIAYAEAHQLAAGVRRELEPERDKALPGDSGFLLGTQLTLWTGERDTYVSLFLRHARGLAAYDPLASPLTFSNSFTSGGATETLAAIAGNYEKDWFGIMAAGYVRFFRDGSASPTSREKYDEGILIARPQIYLGEHFGIGVEGSYQARRYALLAEGTNENLTASLLRAAVLPYFSPSGRGSFKRPQIGLVYAVTGRPSAARSLYAAEDVFRQRSVEHFGGILAEWWFNFSSYP